MSAGNWVKMRRGILDHVRQGLITGREYEVLVTLIMLADAETGSDTINARMLTYWLPYLPITTAQDVLHSLDRKGYIRRDVKDGDRMGYRYWINKYEITKGAGSASRLDISQVGLPKDVTTTDADSNVRVNIKDKLGVNVRENVKVNVNYYKTPTHQDPETPTHQDNPSTVEKCRVEKPHKKPHEMQRQDAAANAAQIADRSAVSAVSAASARPANAGLVWDRGSWANAKDYGRLSDAQVDYRLAAVDIRMHEGTYYERSSGKPLERDEAIYRITGERPAPKRKEVNANG